MDSTDPNYVPVLPHHTSGYKAEDKGPMIIGVCTAMTILSTIFVALRVFTRQKIMGKLHLDDWLVIPSVVSPSIRHDNFHGRGANYSADLSMGLHSHGDYCRRARQWEAL